MSNSLPQNPVVNKEWLSPLGFNLRGIVSGQQFLHKYAIHAETFTYLKLFPKSHV